MDVPLPAPPSHGGSAWRSHKAAVDLGADGEEGQVHMPCRQACQPHVAQCGDTCATAPPGMHAPSITARIGQGCSLGAGREAKNNQRYFLNQYIHPTRCPVAAAL